MGDDFDLFPKREHLDPFSFDSKEEEKGSADASAQEDDVVFDDDRASGDAAQPEAQSMDGEDMPKPSLDSPDFDLPADFFSEEPAEDPHSSIPDAFEGEPESSSGPIPDEDPDPPEPVEIKKRPPKARRSKPDRKGPSAFVLVGGAILVILVLLWAALTYLKKERRPIVSAPIQQKAQIPSVELEVVRPTPVEVSESSPGKAPAAQEQEAPGDQSPASAERGVQVPPVEPTKQEPAASTADEEKTAAVSPTVKTEGSVRQGRSTVLGASGYSVQVGALILQSSVKELENKLSGTGYEPFYKKGTTRASMNFLTVGPFTRDEGTKAHQQIVRTGIEATIRHTSRGYVINAGGYLLSGNARRVSGRIRALGYPVKLERRETQMPITLVRVGKYASKAEAARSRDELKKKGFDAIVVKLQ